MHNLVVGISGSGKTNLCKYIANISNYNVIVFDPLKSGGWGNKAKCFSELNTFSNFLDRNNSALVFLDEAKLIFDENKKLGEKWLYQYRHKGYLFFVIAQRTKMIPPNARNMCSNIYAFKQKYEDTKILIEEYGEELTAVSKLEKMHFIFSDGFDIKKAHLEFDNNKPFIRGFYELE